MTIPVAQAPVSHEWGSRLAHSRRLAGLAPGRRRSRRAALCGRDADPAEKAASLTFSSCTAVRRLGRRGEDRERPIPEWEGASRSSHRFLAERARRARAGRHVANR